MKFFIKQHSTLPTLKFQLTEKIMRKYNISNEMMENVAITFSMIDEYGNYKIANKSADLFVKDENSDELIQESRYILLYNFSLKDTKNTGIFYGEFKIDFLENNGGCGKITIPNNDKIIINIVNSATKTTIV